MPHDHRQTIAVRAILAVIALLPASLLAGVRIEKLHEKRIDRLVEIRGVSAGAFEPALWQKGTLNWVEDIRQPFLPPRDGKFRNIYAPAVVQIKSGWRIFYGGWDGVPTSNDRIYTGVTTDWRNVTDRKTVIEHGAFQHVCNVCAVRERDDSFALMCTAYPDDKGLNKPAFFHWKPGEATITATSANLVSMIGYDHFADGDMNGMNGIVRETGGKIRLYFGNFRDFGKTCRASSDDGTHFTFDGIVLDGSLMVNDVKRLRVRGEWWYLMGLHHNSDELLYTLSQDGMKFPPARRLFKSSGPAEQYIVAIGWVTSGSKVLGVLYGAGAAASLDQNRIFARWLQRKVIWIAQDGTQTEARAASGPDTAIFNISGKGHFNIEQADEHAAATDTIQIHPGDVLQISAD